MNSALGHIAVMYHLKLQYEILAKILRTYVEDQPFPFLKVKYLRYTPSFLFVRSGDARLVAWSKYVLCFLPSIVVFKRSVPGLP